MKPGIYPVYFFSSPHPIAYARFGKIHVSIVLAQLLEPGGLSAVCAHEEAHLVAHHALRRLLFNAVAGCLYAAGFALGCALISPWPFAACALFAAAWNRLLVYLDHFSEFQADAYAVAHGHGRELSRALKRVTNEGMLDWQDALHPSTNERLRRINVLLESGNYETL